MDIGRVLNEIGGRRTIDRNLPEDLKTYSCFVPDSGYCILCVPEIFASKGENYPEMYCIPIPERYVVEKGYRHLKNGMPCVNVEYDNTFGAMIDEKYESWR